MLRIAIITFLLLCQWHYIEAQQVTITGHAPEYAGATISVYSYDNYISLSEVKLGECAVSSSGDFNLMLHCENTQLIYTYLGVYTARLFVEPGHYYELDLPTRKDKTPEEASSPFFQAVTIYMSLKSVKDKNGKSIQPEDELNLNIIKFDDRFNPVYDELAMNTMRRKRTNSDSIINAFKAKTTQTSNLYFNEYAKYRIGLLYYVSQQAGVRHISETFFARRPIRYNNEAYMELFDATYKEYFMYFGRTEKGQAIYNAINQKGSITEVKRLLAQDQVLPGDSLSELVILKNIYEEFYSDRFSRQALLKLLDSIALQTNIAKHKEIAGQIRFKITKLLRGYAPPEFSLYNQDSILTSLQAYKGKYIYLMFCTTQNYVCFSQYELLRDLYQTHGKWLQIVVISADDRFATMRDFRKSKGYAWDFLHYGNDPDIISQYDIRTIPTYYLIDPDGKLVLSPAPAPNENLEQTLFYELNGKGLWREYVKKGWIEDRK